MIVDLLEIFSSRLKQLMNIEELSARNLAKSSNVSRRSIGMYLQGIYPPHYDSLVKIANFFEVSTDYLLGLEEEYYDRYKSVCEINEIPIIFLTRLKQLMQKENLSQNKLAQKMKMEQATVSKWLLMKAMPEVDSLIALSKVFDYPVDYFLCREKLMDS